MSHPIRSIDTWSMNNEGTLRQLRQMKFWVALGSIGFLLVGAAALTFALAAATAMSTLENEYSGESPSEERSEFRAQAQVLFEEGKLEKLAEHIELRKATHPHDANVHWYTARLHSVRAEWADVLRNLDQTALLAPSWKAEYVDPMRDEVRRRTTAAE